MPQNRFVLLHENGQYLSINDGNHWICVEDPAAATILTETKANNILQNMIKPKERTHWKLSAFSEQPEKPAVEEIPQEEVPQPSEPVPTKKTRGRKKAQPKAEEVSAKKAEIPAKVVPAKAPHAPRDPGGETVSQWIEKADSLRVQYELLLKRKKDLADQLRQVSAELCDLEHYIEFTSLNAVKGYRIYRRLRDCLIRRRQIKDELMCISIFLKAEPHNILNGNLTRQFSGLRTREYTPRVLDDLFSQKEDREDPSSD